MVLKGQPTHARGPEGLFMRLALCTLLSQLSAMPVHALAHPFWDRPSEPSSHAHATALLPLPLLPPWLVVI